jgi:hypothetical protein
MLPQVLRFVQLSTMVPTLHGMMAVLRGSVLGTKLSM